MKKIGLLLILVFLVASCEKSEMSTEIDFSLNGSTWMMYKENVKEEKVGIDGTIRKRATYWDCKKTTNGESCSLVTYQNQWNDYRDDDVVHDVTYKITGKIEFTEISVIVHLKRSYITVFGEFPMADIYLNEEYSINGKNGQITNGDVFYVLEDGGTMSYNGDVYIRE